MPSVIKVSVFPGKNQVLFTPPVYQQNYTLQGMAPVGSRVIFGNDDGYVFGLDYGTIPVDPTLETYVHDANNGLNSISMETW